MTAVLRRLAGTVLAGALLGALVGGVGSRLAMMLLAVLNPEASGVTTDDGFRIGQLTLGGTISLVVAAGLIGAVGGLLLHLVRPLLIGPRWFQVASMAIGPGVVVGAVLVHAGGVDFRILDPLGLAVALFVAVPTLFAGTLLLLAERWDQPGAWPARAPVAVALSPLLLLAPLAIVVVPVVLVAGLVLLARRFPRVRQAMGHPALPWVGRGALALVFLVGVIDLTRDVAALT